MYIKCLLSIFNLIIFSPINPINFSLIFPNMLLYSNLHSHFLIEISPNFLFPGISGNYKVYIQHSSHIHFIDALD